jgi:pimeloyl-ACP methyl ester carboxylesterase
MTAGLEHPFTSQPLEADLAGAGVRVRYLDWGPAPGPPILFLHGGGLNAHTWDVVCDLLRQEFRCIAPDLRGHGESEWDPRGEYSLGAYADDLSAVVTALHLDRLVLVGMSLGGMVALDYAATHPAQVLALVLVDTGPGGSRATGRRRLGTFMEGPAEFASLDEVIDRALRFNPRRSRERLRRTLLNNLRQTPTGTWMWKYDPRILMLGSRHELTEEEMTRRLTERRDQLWRAAAHVACPTLIVRGGESDMFLDADAERTAEGFKTGRWVRIDGASHTVQSDRPYELAAVLLEFVHGLSDLTTDDSRSPP